MDRLINRFIFFISIGLLLQSCLSEDELSFPPEESSDTLQVVQSTGIVTLLNALGDSILGVNNLCFEFLFPIELGFNNDITIEVDDMAGLLEAVNSQSLGLNIDGIVFPVLVAQGSTLKNIEGEEDLLKLLTDCGIPSFKDDFHRFFTKCFDLVYPVSLLDQNGETHTIDNAEQYFDFKIDQGFAYQPRFVFPLGAEVFSEDTIISIDGYFGLYEIFNSCPDCPELFFSTDAGYNNRYTFTVNFPGKHDLFSYDWYINDDFVETDGVGVDGDHMLKETFPPGVYEICVKAVTDKCQEGTYYCEVIEVEEFCPELHFEFSHAVDTPSVFQFIADFQLKDEIPYVWKVFQEDILLYSETEEPGGDNKMFFEFDTGAYETCIFTETDLCPEGVWYCEEIEVADLCPQLFFEYEKLDSATYQFFAEFEGMTEIPYLWAIYVNDDLIHSEEDGQGRDNLMEYQFHSPGVYEICLHTETDRCPEGATYCEELVIE